MRALRDADGELVPDVDDAPPPWRRVGWIALFIAVGVVAAGLLLYALA